MSGLKAPQTRSRTQTADLATFLRETGPPEHAAQGQRPFHPAYESRGPVDDPTSPSTGSKKRSMIPSFFSSKNKSNAAASVTASTASNKVGVHPQPSSSSISSSKTKASRVMQLTRKSISESVGSRHSSESQKLTSPNARPSSSHSSTASKVAPTPPVVPPLNLGASSLSSKLVSHFKPSSNRASITPSVNSSTFNPQITPSPLSKETSRRSSVTSHKSAIPPSLSTARSVPSPKSQPRQLPKHRPSHLTPVDAQPPSPNTLSPPNSSKTGSFESPRSSTSTTRPPGYKPVASSNSLRPPNSPSSPEFSNPRSAPTPPGSAGIREREGQSYFENNSENAEKAVPAATSTSETSPSAQAGPSVHSPRTHHDQSLINPLSTNPNRASYLALKLPIRTSVQYARDNDSSSPRGIASPLRSSSTSPKDSPVRAVHQQPYPQPYHQVIPPAPTQPPPLPPTDSPRQLSRNPSRELLMQIGRTSSKELLTTAIVRHASRETLATASQSQPSVRDSSGSSFGSAGPPPSYALPKTPSSEGISPVAGRPAHYVRKHTHSAVRQLEDALGTPVDVDSDDDEHLATRTVDEDERVRPTVITDSPLPTPPPSLVLNKLPHRGSLTGPRPIVSASPRSPTAAPTGPPTIPLPGLPIPSAAAAARNSVSSQVSSANYFTSESATAPSSWTNGPPLRTTGQSLRTQPSSSVLTTDSASVDVPSISSVQTSPTSPSKNDTPSSDHSDWGFASYESVYQRSSLRETPPRTETQEIERLKEELADSKQRYQVLQEYMDTITDKLERQKAALEKRVETLEHQNRKMDREIVGLRYLVLYPDAVDPSGPPIEGVAESLLSRAPSISRSTSDSQISLLPPVPSFGGTIDLGFSLTQSGTPSAASSSRKATGRQRAMTLPRQGSSKSDFNERGPRTPTMDDFVPSPPGISPMVSTFAATASASTPRTSATMPTLKKSSSSTMLSAIPESPALAPVEGGDTDVSTDDEEGEPRVTRHVKRHSASSARQRILELNANALVTQAYASDLATGRAPSIDQVLTRQSTPDYKPADL